MKYLSLFSGIGGFEKGIEQAYENNRKLLQGKKATDIRENSTDNKSRQNGVTCIGYSEIDKYAIQVYKKHFPTHTNFGDITKIKSSSLPDFELLVGGFPCQSFSIAGKRGGFNDTRGTLFFEIARIVRKKQPRLLLLENVKGLLSHDQGGTFYTIISTLDELGYDCQWQVLNSKNFGVPQNRERVFIAGHLRGTRRPEIFPIGEGNKKPVKQNTQRNDIAHTITNTDKHRGSYVKGDVLQGVSNKRPSIRRLTPTECERLQGFPDGWTEGLSDTQRYKTLGNAISVPVVKYIAEKLLACA